MARKIGKESETTVYRAVITKPGYRGRDKVTTYEGPYRTVGAARARVTFWQNCYDGEASGYVEAGHLTWVSVND